MGENHPKRETRRMRNPQPLSDHYQFTAVGESDSGSKRPAIKQQRSKKHCAPTEQLRSGPGNRSSILLELLVRSAASHSRSSRKLLFPANHESEAGRIPTSKLRRSDPAERLFYQLNPLLRSESITQTHGLLGREKSNFFMSAPAKGFWHLGRCRTGRKSGLESSVPLY